MSTTTMVANRTAREVQQGLAAFDVHLPDLDEALDAYQAAADYQGPERPDLDLAALDLSSATAAKVIDAAADAHLRRAAIKVVKADLLDRLNRRLLRVLHSERDEILTALETPFTTAAESFTESMSNLPAGWADPAVIVDAGPATLRHLHEAQAQVPTLDVCRRIRRAVVKDANPIHEGTAYAKVDHTTAAERAAQVSPAGPCGHWGNLLATEGVQALHWWPTTKAHHDYANSLPVRDVATVSTTHNGFRGYRQVVR